MSLKGQDLLKTNKLFKFSYHDNQFRNGVDGAPTSESASLVPSYNTPLK